MGYTIYKDGAFYKEYEETSYGYKKAKIEYNELKRRHKKTGERITLCGIWGDILEDTRKN